ncbi:MAG: sulfotransferase, partial [Acidobacteriota bacterium]
MQLPRDPIRLPLRFDARTMVREITALPDELWHEEGSGSSGVWAAPLVAPGGEAAPGRPGAMMATPALGRSPYLAQALAALGGIIGRARVVRLDAGARLSFEGAPPSLKPGRLCVHIPAVPPAGLLEADGRAFELAAGEAWLLDPSRLRELRFPGDLRRLHLVADLLPSPSLDALAGAAAQRAGEPAAETIQLVEFVPGKAPELVLAGPGGGAPPPPPEARKRTDAPSRTGEAGGNFIARPVLIVCPPRSGSSMLFEALAQSPQAWTIRGESQALIEGLDPLHPRMRRWESNRLTAADATPEIATALRSSFLARLRDRNQQSPRAGGGLRLLEKTPRNALRTPFLRAIFPDSTFIYLYRNPLHAISSMLDAWRSRRFVSYPDLPGWEGPPWSLLLIPGWRSLAGKPLAEIVAEQWATTTRCLLDDLEQLPAGDWCIASYERLLAEPQAEVERLCAFAGLAWDRRIAPPLPLAASTLTPPDPEKWKRNAAELEVALPLVRAVADRARELFAEPPPSLPARRGRPRSHQAPQPPA